MRNSRGTSGRSTTRSKHLSRREKGHILRILKRGGWGANADYDVVLENSQLKPKLFPAEGWSGAPWLFGIVIKRNSVHVSLL